MRILHTADWHLGDRLGRIDRTADLRRSVERVARYCAEEKVDLLLVAGDLFSELAGPDGLREAIRHLRQVFEDFLGRGGTILTLTGNHDKETFCQTLRHAMSLASPLSDHLGAVVQPGRLCLAVAPTLLRLEDRAAGALHQFLLMPYPTPSRYLTDETTQRYTNLEEKNRCLMSAFTRRLHELQTCSAFDPNLATVLAAHVHVRGSTLHSTFRMSEQEDVVFDDADLPLAFAYIALGHIHKPQALNGLVHVRYPGSIERLDLGEARDDKGVVLVELGPEGLREEPFTLPLDATPIYEVVIRSPKDELEQLPQKYADHDRALVRIECTYTAGVDNREETLRKLEEVFPNWYDRQLTEANALGPTLVQGEASRSASVEETVRNYLRQELAQHPDAVRDAVLARAELLLREVQA
jgi:exonuclease SbcD